MTATYDAVVLAGGRSTRMDVDDKTRLTVAGTALLDRVLAACASATQRVVVGVERATAMSVTWTREQPVGSGPAAALEAGLRLVTAPVVVVLAGDQPLLDAATVEQLVASLDADGADVDGVVPVDCDGREQWLCSAWRAEALRTVELPADGSLRSGLGTLSFRHIELAVTDAPAWFDCDTPDDVKLAEEMLP